MIKRIGFIGLGAMGKPMATNLISGGYQLVVHDRNREPVKELMGKGAEDAASPKEASETADAVISMLPDDHAAKEVATGDDGAIEGMKKGTILVDMSTVSPSTAKGIAEKLEASGMEMLDAPVSGGPGGAIEGTLSIMVGGKKDVFESMLPVLGKMGKNISHIGGHGAGQVAKASNQIIVALTIEAVAEALIFAKKSGVDPQKVRQALLGGFAHSPVLEIFGQRMVERDFDSGAQVRLLKKDIEIIMTAAKELGMYLPGTSLVSQLWNAVAAHDGLNRDHSIVITVLERMSEIEVCPG